MKVVNTAKNQVELLHAPLKVLKVPFVKKTSEFATGVQFMKGDVIVDCRIKVVANVAGSTIDVGLDGTTHNDGDGLLDGVSCATAGRPKVIDNTETASLVGALLQSGVEGVAAVAANEAGPSGLLIAEDNCPLTYTTSDHAITGYIYVFFYSCGEDYF
jgi:hypothetical protein